MERVPYPFSLRLVHVMSTRSALLSIAAWCVSFLLIPGRFLPLVLVLVGGAALYFILSGRLLFEANRKYVLWLGRKATERITGDPGALVIETCREADTQGLSAIRTRETPFWYSPKSLKPLAVAFLKYPPEVVFHLVNRILPTIDGQAIGIHGSTSGLAADLMMTYERMHVLEPSMGGSAAYVLAIGILAAPTLQHARMTLREIGQTEAAAPQLREEMAVVDARMTRAVVEALGRLDPYMARYVAR